MRTLGTSLAKKPRAKPPIGFSFVFCAACTMKGKTSSAVVPMRSHTSGVVARAREFNVASSEELLALLQLGLAQLAVELRQA